MDEFLQLVFNPDQRLISALRDAIPGSGRDITVLTESLAKIFMYRGKIIPLIEQLIIHEVNNTSKQTQQLFLFISHTNKRYYCYYLLFFLI